MQQVVEGFPFDDDVTHGKSKLKDHLEDLAKRHPELADQLKDWAEIERSPKIPRKFSGGPREEFTDETDRKVQQQTSEGSCSAGPSKGPNLRATVPDMQAQQEKMDQRNQRSQSAPPEGPPVKGAMPAESAMHQPTVDNNHSKQQNNGLQNNLGPQQPQQQQNRSNERYIPIFVEGRGETIVNVPVQSEKAQPQPATQTPPPRQKKAAQSKATPPGTASPQPPPPASAPSPQPCQETTAEPQAAPAPPPQPARPPSPLTLVANIQKEVDDLRQRVEAFKGTKIDKEYIYLDEMLTRNLLKLDNIDSEGRDEVRAARKEVIRSIQQCITSLESAPNGP